MAHLISIYFTQRANLIGIFTSRTKQGGETHAEAISTFAAWGGRAFVGGRRRGRARVGGDLLANSRFPQPTAVLTTSPPARTARCGSRKLKPTRSGASPSPERRPNSRSLLPIAPPL